MILKKLGASVVLGMVAVAAANANTVTLDALPGVYPGLGGGEFTAYTSVSYLSHYAGGALYNPSTGFNGDPNSGGTGFETFCLETGVDFSPGSTYYYTLGQISQPVPPSGAGSAIPLSQGAAWLYYQFGKGLLGDFHYGYGSARQADDNLLQAAIWAFQGNQSYPNYPGGITGNKFYTDALNALGANALANYTGTSVQILQMWSLYDPSTGDYSGAAQNQLVLTGDTGFSAVPDGGLTIGLLGVAFAGISFLQRRLRA